MSEMLVDFQEITQCYILENRTICNLFFYSGYTERKWMILRILIITPRKKILHFDVKLGLDDSSYQGLVLFSSACSLHVWQIC